MSYQKRLMIFFTIIALTFLIMAVYFAFNLKTTVNNLEGGDIEIIPENIF